MHTTENHHASGEKRKGLWYALGCYSIWGLFPIYWYPLNQSAIGADQILAQRIVWSAIFALLMLLIFKQTAAVRAAFKQPRVLGLLMLSSFLIGINWLVYLWAIVNHHVLDASLGYFINPLFNVLLGGLIFKEQLNRAQKSAVVLAFIGILWLALPAGQIPWVALLLAFSFGGYGLIRKLAPMEALPGLALETLLIVPFALAYLAWYYTQGTLVFGELNTLQISLLIGSGAITTIPLLFFAASAKRIPLSLLGILQYGAPTLQFLIGLTLFGESFDFNRFIGYLWVWTGVAVFLLAGWRARKMPV